MSISSTTSSFIPAASRSVPVPPPGSLDARGPRFAAAVSSLALAVVLVAPPPASVIVLVLVVGAFTQGAVRGVQATPQSWVFRRLVRPRLAPARDWESSEAPRFAQGVGLGLTVIALAAFVTGLTLVGQVAVGAALAAALLNAAFGFCLGCKVYAIRLRLLSRPVPFTPHR